MKIDKKLKHASHTTIFSALRQVISGFTSGHGSSPGSFRKIMRKFAPICGAAMPRPYPVDFRQNARVSARSSTSIRISGAAGSLTFFATTRKPGSPSCNTVRIAIVKPLRLSDFGPLPSPRFPSPKYRFDHRHIRNGILERHGNLASLPNSPRKRISLYCILIANRNCFHPNSPAKYIVSIINKNPASTIRWRIKRYLDLNPPLRPQELHPLVRHQLRAASEHRLPRRKLQNRRRQPVRLEIRISFNQSQHAHGLLSKDKPRGRNWVAPDIHQPASAPLYLVPHVRGIPVKVAERPHNRAQLSNHAFANQFARSQPLRVRLDHERFADLHSAAISHFQKRFCLRHRQAQRLFAQHVLPRLRRSNGPLHVQVIR